MAARGIVLHDVPTPGIPNGQAFMLFTCFQPLEPWLPQNPHVSSVQSHEKPFGTLG